MFPAIPLQFHLLPIRDWNSNAQKFLSASGVELQFHLLPIRDWNFPELVLASIHTTLQFHLLPIRDWN